MNESARDALIGLCTFAAVAGVLLLLYLFNEVNFESRWSIQVHAPSTSGLRANSAVQLDGVPIGVVQHIALTPDEPWPVRIDLGIDDGVQIPVGVTTLSKASLLTGGANLYLESPATRSGEMLPADGSAVLAGPIQSMTVRDLEIAIKEQVGPTLDTFNKLGGAWAAVGEDLSVLLGGNATDEPGGVAAILSQVDRAARAAADWVDNPALRNEVNEFMHMAIAGMDRVVLAMESFDGLLAHLDKRSETLTDEFAKAGRALSDALHQTRTLLAGIESGKGTAGLLVTNPDLYNDLRETTVQLDRLGESLRLMIEQGREEGIGPFLGP